MTYALQHTGREPAGFNMAPPLDADLMERVQIVPGMVKFGDVEMSQEIANQISRRGFGEFSYSPGQIQAMKLASVIDCQVFDDPHGLNLEDQLEHTPEEERRRAQEEALLHPVAPDEELTAFPAMEPKTWAALIANERACARRHGIAFSPPCAN